jgi:hypothetical protein
MKKIILFILVFSSTLSFAQITLYHNVYVNSEDQSKFEMVERDYMSILAQKAVNDGKFIYWALEKVLQPSNTMGGEVNHQLVGNWYQFVIVYSDMKAYLNAGPWWSDTDNLLGVPQELLSYKVKQGGMYLWHIKDSAMVTGAKFSAYNFGFSEEPSKFIESQKEYKVFFENMNKTNQNGRAGWVSGVRVSPKNFGEHNVMTWDGFLTLEDAMNHWTNWVESKKEYKKIHLPNGFDLKMIAAKIAETSAPSN